MERSEGNKRHCCSYTTRQRFFCKRDMAYQALLVGGGRQLVSDALAVRDVALVLIIIPALRGEVLLVQLQVHSDIVPLSTQTGHGWLGDCPSKPMARRHDLFSASLSSVPNRAAAEVGVDWETT